MFLSRCSRGVSVALFLGLFGCGSRTTIGSGYAGPDDDDDQVVPECVTNADCPSLCAHRACQEGQCVYLENSGPSFCDDGDPCTFDLCDDALGCSNTQLTADADGDGHYAVLPGFLPGEEGACGDDCDDTSASAHPGGVEVCDGTDNDCDGVIDNGHTYLSQRRSPVRVPSDASKAAGASGIAYGGGSFAVSYGADIDGWKGYVRGFRSAGDVSFEEQTVTDVNVQSFGAVLEWSGSSFGAAWADPRQDGNYEVYFTRFGTFGEKLGPDLRVTDAVNFSIRPSMIHDQGRFLLAWDDRRTNGLTDEAIIYGQIVDNDGNLVGGNVPLTSAGAISEYAQIAASGRRLGVTFTVLDPVSGGVYLGFRSFDKNFGSPSAVVQLGDGYVVSPRVTGLRDRFVVTWGTNDGFPGPTVWAALLDEAGNLLGAPTPVTPFDLQDPYARMPATVSLGDRFVLVWVGLSNGHTELFGEVLDENLAVIEPRTQLTFEGKDAAGPIAALSQEGMLGIAFDQFLPSHDAFFMAVGCYPHPTVR